MGVGLYPVGVDRVKGECNDFVKEVFEFLGGKGCFGGGKEGGVADGVGLGVGGGEVIWRRSMRWRMVTAG